jgi:hypothetical protein
MPEIGHRVAGSTIARVDHRSLCAERPHDSVAGPCDGRKAQSLKSEETVLAPAGREDMIRKGSIGALALGAALLAGVGGAQAFDDSKYPNLHGQWRIIGGPMRFDTNRPWGLGQQAPLTPEYEKIFEANLKDQAEGGQGDTPTFTCISPGMPRTTNSYGQVEFVVTPATTYILVDHIHDDRRIFTDGRAFPDNLEPTLLGYSVGQWLDEGDSGRYNVLEVETRGFKGPRAFDSSGIPLHKDNQTIVKERYYLDKADPNILHNQVTVYDHALTRPWTVIKSLHREPNPRPFWREVNCSENNDHVQINKQSYMISADGFLMPTKKGQPAPDLRYFTPVSK